MSSPDGILIPQAIDAERAVLGAMILSPKAITEAANVLAAEHFYRPQHALVYSAIAAMNESGKPVDGVTLAAELLASGNIAKVGGHAAIHSLVSETPTAANITWYAEQVRSTYRRRRASEIGQRLVQAATQPSTDDAWLDAAARSTLEMELLIDEKTGEQEITGLSTWDAFIEGNTGVLAEWVVPGLVAAQDVVMVLAPPGAGKTTLSRQMCWTIAAGLHPFSIGHRIEPQRTLLIDLEVDPATAADESHAPLGQVRRLGDYDADRAWVWSYVQGLNLRKREDQQLFERVISDVRPKFVALGSLYKTGVQARSGESYEVAANEVREFFDKCRRRYRFALWIEHHMPKGEAGGRKPNPFGSSVWEWWPSHGRVLERAGISPGAPFRFSAPFRGDRGKRDYPVGFTRGGKLPWTPVLDEAELEQLIEASGGKL